MSKFFIIKNKILLWLKTTIDLDEEIYKKLIEESTKRFGSAKKISFLINEKLKKAEMQLELPKIMATEKTFGLWKDWNISSEKCVRKIRKESEKRLKRLTI
jgi:hypothetical protein